MLTIEAGVGILFEQRQEEKILALAEIRSRNRMVFLSDRWWWAWFRCGRTLSEGNYERFEREEGQRHLDIKEKRKGKEKKREKTKTKDE